MSEYCHIQTLERRGRESFDKERCDQIDERIDEFEKAIRNFLNRFDESSVLLDKPTLATAILDYFVDVQRLKDFHDSISRINEDKIIAYESAWILKRKPIQPLSDEIGFIHINERFIAEVIMNHLVGGFRDDKVYPEVSKCAEIKEFYKHLFYYLTCCPPDAQALELMIVAFKTALEASKVCVEAPIRSFTEKEGIRFDERIEKFETVCQNFLISSGFNDSSVRLNRLALELAFRDYSVDVRSLKSIYNSEANINEDKVVAYICAGILKYKPIQLLCDDVRLIHINEKFVVHVIRDYLIGSLEDDEICIEINRCDELKEFYNHLLYHLIYRPTNPSSLEFMIVAFKAAFAIVRVHRKVSNKV